jgi:hypothetical protein
MNVSITNTIILFLIITQLLVRTESISREDFPDGFIFGTASSAHQVLSFNNFIIEKFEIV